ncbi:MAG: diguanylate cyclase [Cyanobacteria bacterium P01_D01_bin.105]
MTVHPPLPPPPLSAPSKPRRPSVGLQTLLLCFSTGVAIIPILFLGTWVYHNALSSREKAVVEKHQLLAKNISEELAVYGEDLDTLFSERSQGEPVPFTEEGKMLLRAKQIRMLAFMKDDSRLYCMGDESWLPQGGMDELHHERHLAWLRPGKTRISPVKINQRGEPTIYLLRVTDVRQLAVAAVNTDYFMTVQERINFGGSGHAAIVDQDGNVLAHPSSDWERSAKNLLALAPIALMQERSQGVAKFYSPAVNDHMIAGYARSPKTGWGVMIPQRYSEIQSQALETKKIALAVSIMGLGFAIVISWRLTRYILGPIQAVIQSAKTLESGQPVAPLATNLATAQRHLPKEFINLLMAFDHMAAEIANVRTNLELRVVERTQKLEEEVNWRKHLQQQLIQQATHDALTGLPNRRLLTERLTSLVALSQRSGGSFAVLFLDLDGFKKVNDTYGHKTGDDLLIEISKRLKQNLRKSDAIFRLGGDEFVILIERISRIETAQQITQLLTEKLFETLRAPLLIGGDEISVGASIGVKISNGHEPAEQILSDADDAMYQAKVKGNCAIVH